MTNVNSTKAGEAHYTASLYLHLGEEARELTEKLFAMRRCPRGVVFGDEAIGEDAMRGEEAACSKLTRDALLNMRLCL